MKKIFTVMLVFVIIFSFAACGKDKNNAEQGSKESTLDGVSSSAPDNNEDTQPSVPINTDTQTDPSENGSDAEPVTETPDDATRELFKKIQAYIDREKGDFEAQKKQIESIMAMDLYREDKSIVLEYKYVNEVNVTAEQLSDSIDTSAGNAYKAMYDDFAAAVEDDSVSVILRYLKPDGTLIIDKIIDKDYVVVNSNDTLPDTAFNSLSEFVASEYFQNLISSQSTDEIRLSATVKDENTLVLIYTYIKPLEPAMIAALQQTWPDSIKQSMANGFETITRLVLGLIQIDHLVIENYLLDSNNNVISVYTYE